MSSDTDAEEARQHTIRKATKIEWGLIYGLAIQTAALIWGAAKLTAGVDNLNNNMAAMSDYAVLRYRVEQHETALRSQESEIQSLRMQLQQTLGTRR